MQGQTGRQAGEALRHIASQVDRLIEALANGGGSGTSGSMPAASPETSSSGVHTLPSQEADGVLVQHFHRLVSILDPNDLFGAIISSGVALTGAQRGFLTMIEQGNKLRFKSGIQITQQDLARPEFAGARGVIKQVLQGGRPVRVPPEQSGGQHVLCAPLKFGKRLDGTERVGGAIFVDTPPAGKQFGDKDLQVLFQLADQAAIALENAYIFHRGEQDKGQILRLKDNITKLYDVGQSIASTLILDDLLVIIVDHVVQISRAQRGFIMLLEGSEEQKSLEFKVGRDARKRTLNRDHFAFSTSMANKAIASKKSQIMTEAMGADLSVSMVQMELQSIMCVPLVEKEKVIGLVYVDSQQSNKEFDTSDLEIVESLCGQASVAIVNAQLYQAAAEQERLAHELELASKIQMDLLPKEVPPVNGLAMFGFLVPALEVGGDYYDFIPHEGTQDSLTIAIGDVSGKGVGAGLVMAMARSALRSLIQHEGCPTTPLDIMKSLNVMMCRDIPPGMFMTLNVLIWDSEKGRLKYTSAGHEHLIIYRAATRKVEKIKAGGVACGVLKQASAMYKEQILELRQGDHLLLYTDGVTEAMNIENQEFGLDTTVDLVGRYGHLDPKGLCEAVHQEIVRFVGAAKPHDDITMVTLKVT